MDIRDFLIEILSIALLAIAMIATQSERLLASIFIKAHITREPSHSLQAWLSTRF